MKPITPINIVEKGIAVYCPSIKEYSHIQIEIYYSKTNPLFSWVVCDNRTTKLWEKKVVMDKNGTLFIYVSSVNLSIGFYKIEITAFKNTGEFIEGSLQVGLNREKSSLVIGMPYSSFAPIALA